MITSSLDGGAFHLKTGIPWTAGLNRYRDTDTMNIRWVKTSSISGRWYFEIEGVKYSAKTLSPLTDIQMYTEKWSPMISSRLFKS